jgi:hypothetical protein
MGPARQMMSLLSALAVTLGAVAALARLLSSFLYGVRALDPSAFATAGVAPLAVGLLARSFPRDAPV